MVQLDFISSSQKCLKIWSGLSCPLQKKHMISSGLFSSVALFSCYETLKLKSRLPQFITGGTKAKAVDKARQTNSNQLPVNTHVTSLTALLRHKWPIQDFSSFFLISFHTITDEDEDTQHKPTGWTYLSFRETSNTFFHLIYCSRKMWCHTQLVFIHYTVFL